MTSLLFGLIMGFFVGIGLSINAYKDDITKKHAIYFQDIEYRCEKVGK